MFPEAATQSLRGSRFRGSCAKYTHFVLKTFHNLSMIIKNIFDGWFKPIVLHVPLAMLLFNRPAQCSYHRLCSGLSYAY